MTSIRVAVRSIAWGLLATIIGIAGAVLVLTRWGDGDTARSCSLSVTLASLALPAVAGVALDDAAWELTASSPRALWHRRILRVVSVSVGVAISWAGFLVAARLAFPQAFETVDVTMLSARVAAIALAAVALAAALARFRRDHVGLIAAGLLTAVAILWNEIHPAELAADGAGPWLAAALVAAAGAVAACREPLPR